MAPSKYKHLTSKGSIAPVGQDLAGAMLWTSRHLSVLRREEQRDGAIFGVVNT
jgi:hypothetical protein